jgi:hypothetical protein
MAPISARPPTTPPTMPPMAPPDRPPPPPPLLGSPDDDGEGEAEDAPGVADAELVAAGVELETPGVVEVSD